MCEAEGVSSLKALGEVAGFEFPFGVCGVPDDIESEIEIQTFGSPGGRWERRALSFSVNPAGANLSPSVVTSTVAKAFSVWQGSLGGLFTFSPVGAGGDVHGSFGLADLDPDFGTIGGVLASGAYPPDGSLNFDRSEPWTAVSLLNAAVHEIGHILGLAHSNNPASVMYPAIRKTAVVDAESIDAVRSLYGWAPQASIGDRATSDRPALAVTRAVGLAGVASVLRMAWKGAPGDSGLYESELGPDGWTPQAAIHGEFGSSHSPALSEFLKGDGISTGVMMAWKGVGDDQGIYTANDVGFGWSDPENISGIGSSNRPAIALYNGIPYMAWKGDEGDSSIWWSRLVSGHWASQRSVNGVGTSNSPALAPFQGRLYMFWKGLKGDSRIYYSSISDSDPIWQPQRNLMYADTEAGGGQFVPVGTSEGPSVAADGGRLAVAWKGAGTDPGLYFSFFDGSEFTGQIRMDHAGTSQGPAVAEADGILFAAWKGIEGDDSMWWSKL
ncbi:matrixin family metalloprotease [Kitasatospora purpeofusca]|uniref:matrixin family metalloprotease n=1 Tax=Kitasatospora purpeofusca TaxID=67352 RepID=UPI00368C3F38